MVKIKNFFYNIVPRINEWLENFSEKGDWEAMTAKVIMPVILLFLIVFLFLALYLVSPLKRIVQSLAEAIRVWFHWTTLGGATWRGAVAICDWRTHLRKLRGEPIVDAVFITNMRDNTDRRRFLGKWYPKHFNGPRYWMNGISGRTRALNVTAKDLATEKGRELAREYFLSAVRWAQNNGARVILLAAGTKRLFGENGTELKEKFPDLIFGIGDNGTMYLLKEETFRALDLAKLRPGYSRIGVLGPYGLLGEYMTKVLTAKGYEVIGVGPNSSALEKIGEKFNIKTCQTFEEMGEVDAVIACTHSEKIRLTADIVRNTIRKKNKKLLVVDVAEPSNLKYREWEKCQDVCIRQDAGNAYSKKLKYVLGAISYKMFRLTQGVTFGCFAETLTIAAAIKCGEREELS